MVMKGRLVAYLQLASAIVLVGGSIAAGKLIVENFSVFLANAMGLAAGSMVLVSMLIREARGYSTPHPRGRWSLLAGIEKRLLRDRGAAFTRSYPFSDTL